MTDDFRPLTNSDKPEDGQFVDWITPRGSQVNGGKFHNGLWFLPPEHSAYAYYAPIAWRPAARKEGK